MKKFIFASLMAIGALSAQAQNIQLHYDFGRSLYSNEEASRPKATVTLEQFKADEWGSWFYFVDIDLSRHFTESAYAEISREINLCKSLPIAAHVEYDGGLNKSGSFQQAGLAGLAYNGHTEDFSKTWSVQVLYKHYIKSYENTHSYASAQLTGVWGMNFLNDKLRFAGFIDFWRGEKANNGHGCLVVLTEPQLWYNITPHLAVGTEWEISNNFVYNVDPTSDKTFFFNPTLALKWNL